MKGQDTYLEYGGHLVRLADIARAENIDVRYLGKWYRAGKLTPERVAEYHKRKELREIARRCGIDARVVSVRVARGMDRRLAVSRPLKFSRKAVG